MQADEYTIEEKNIDVGDGHTLYTHIWGNSKSNKTVLFLHRGPGSGCEDIHKTLFDPTVHKVVFIDQRGSGKSTPHGSIDNNKTDDLVEDINKVMDELKIDEFSITGGSWGSTLGLVYAIKYPKRVKRLILRGIFTSRKSEIDFLDKGGFKDIFPDAWEEYVNTVPKKHRFDPSSYHFDRILGNDPEKAKRSAYHYESLVMRLIGLDDRTRIDSYDEYDPSSITIEVNYLVNACYLPEGYIIKNASKLTMPVDIIQGRYDMICPPFTALDLHNELPNSTLHWTIAGHSGRDRANWQTNKALLSSLD